MLKNNQAKRSKPRTAEALPLDIIRKLAEGLAGSGREERVVAQPSDRRIGSAEARESFNRWVEDVTRAEKELSRAIAQSIESMTSVDRGQKAIATARQLLADATATHEAAADMAYATSQYLSGTLGAAYDKPGVFAALASLLQGGTSPDLQADKAYRDRARTHLGSAQGIHDAVMNLVQARGRATEDDDLLKQIKTMADQARAQRDASMANVEKAKRELADAVGQPRPGSDGHMGQIHAHLLAEEARNILALEKADHAMAAAKLAIVQAVYDAMLAEMPNRDVPAQPRVGDAALN
jgi:exonuclease VII small subunit